MSQVTFLAAPHIKGGTTSLPHQLRDLAIDFHEQQSDRFDAAYLPRASGPLEQLASRAGFTRHQKNAAVIVPELSLQHESESAQTIYAAQTGLDGHPPLGHVPLNEYLKVPQLSVAFADFAEDAWGALEASGAFEQRTTLVFTEGLVVARLIGFAAERFDLTIGDWHELALEPFQGVTVDPVSGFIDLIFFEERAAAYA